MPAFIVKPTFLDHALEGRHAFWRYLVAVLIAFVIQTVVSVVYVMVVVASGVSMADLQSRLTDPSQPMIFFPLIAISFGAWLIGFGLGVMWLHRKSPMRLLGNWTWAGFVLGLVVWLVVLIANVAVDYGLRPEGFTLRLTPVDPIVIGLIVVALFIQTFAEEYIFRGYVTQGLLKINRNIWFVTLVGGLIFGALHIPNGIPQAVSAGAMGIAFTWITLRTGSIAFAAGAHFINNLFGAVIVVSGVDVFKGAPGLITQTTPDLLWWDVGFAAVAMVLIVLVLARRLPPMVDVAPKSGALGELQTDK
ncbi:CPBP family intramembrane glutamic endopeptidase [Asticcacaulis sp. AC402]|uniref:CPBP family intramembrane glutamic endopeptidase n=1 Tax=Asticcacaulis sp. AC402 TaxID=1282361 RepID=UPI0003C41072|nr:CPBP family intramembrane glutamic endopeptidase [Asticcacaulis sp. AC402]ESQ74979.1 hypothetical protein ABAC402_11285 [Asticcacaulis sp. AC402]